MAPRTRTTFYGGTATIGSDAHYLAGVQIVETRCLFLSLFRSQFAG
jgi:hypothetical protein